MSDFPPAIAIHRFFEEKSLDIFLCVSLHLFPHHFVRFGSFEIFKTRDMETGRVGPSVGREDILHQLLDFVTQSYYPHVCG